MDHVNRVLIAGTGPASIQLAVMMKHAGHVITGIAGRMSLRSEGFYASLKASSSCIAVKVQNPAHSRLAGECCLDQVFQGYETITGTWDILILSVTTDAYLQVLKQIPPQVLSSLTTIVLLSPTFGSNRLVQRYVRSSGSAAEIISFSTYLGDTRWESGSPGHQVLTAAVKKRLYISSTDSNSVIIPHLTEMYRNLGVDLVRLSSPLEAETRNLSLIVHPPLFMNDVTLSAIFEKPQPQRYVYKMFPEGPITQDLISGMLAYWHEIEGLLSKLGLSGMNLLQFMTDDNYPVRPESLSRQDIEQFPALEPIHQQYLLYVRYVSLLIDPFSEPDENGRYYDFSAVPIRPVYVNKEGELDIPRMPKEDYYRIKIIQGMAKHLGIPSPAADHFIATYERWLIQSASANEAFPLSSGFNVQSFQEDINSICQDLMTETSKA
ncbi:hypothetical protein E6C60_2222 [Paenibacillus algicola]|uniref:DUF2338 family protein n=1 Tax=Paenibacillus algicola TaxID=2565926 RepID=A0A4P8XKM1_9BACL|nr:opine metallophore biosynthesis dehydrogenase [Paenibacillus algicola]QCT02935.1 hypothetical protein E6C60_2222 [Paenibacillus algicola]